MLLFFFFKQKTAYEMRISVLSSEVSSSDLSFRCRLVLGHDEVRERVAIGLLRLGAPRAQHVDADTPHNGRQPCREIVDRDVLPRQTKPRLLHGILGFGM